MISRRSGWCQKM